MKLYVTVTVLLMSELELMWCGPYRPTARASLHKLARPTWSLSASQLSVCPLMLVAVIALCTSLTTAAASNVLPYRCASCRITVIEPGPGNCKLQFTPVRGDTESDGSAVIANTGGIAAAPWVGGPLRCL